jgi:uncharacterized protein YcbX
VDLSVADLRRYPVKSMGGESLEVARFDRRGVVGDRWYAVEDADGRFASGKSTRRFRRRDRVFDHHAWTDTRDQVVVGCGADHWAVGDPGLDEHLSDVMGAAVAVTPEGDVTHQDAGPVSVVGTATLAWCAARWGGSPDPRRLRPNVVVSSEEPFVEETWLGRGVALGSVRLRVEERAPRCRMIDVPQDDVVPGRRWLRELTRERGMYLGVYARVSITGQVRVGDLLLVL